MSKTTQKSLTQKELIEITGKEDDVYVKIVFISRMNPNIYISKEALTNIEKNDSCKLIRELASKIKSSKTTEDIEKAKNKAYEKFYKMKKPLIAFTNNNKLFQLTA